MSAYPLNSTLSDHFHLTYPPRYRETSTPILPIGPTACTLSHLRTWNIAMEAEDDSFLVLEDDVE